jgi:hypothetical protein
MFNNNNNNNNNNKMDLFPANPLANQRHQSKPVISTQEKPMVFFIF